MGGGGSYYDRDVTDRSLRTSRGYSTKADKQLSESKADKELLPSNRSLVCEAKSPIFYALDVTGSMGNLPKIIWDKMPMIAGQLVQLGYLEDPMMSVAAIGDTRCDDAPLQIADFSLIKNLDKWLKRVWLEGGGGPSDQESYEMMAYFAAKRIEMPNAVTPFCLFTGDEKFYDELSVSALQQFFGGRHKDIDAKTVFDELKKKFKGNVFLIHREYRGGDREVVAQWQGVLGKERVILLPEDLAIADITLGLFAVMSGSRTLDEYCDDMRNRKNLNTGKKEPQGEERIAKVRKALENLETIAPAKTAGKKQKISSSKPTKDAKDKKDKGKGKKDWKIL